MRLKLPAAVLSAMVLVAFTPATIDAQASPVRQVLEDQESAWNRGNIVEFMHGYANSPNTTFIGKTIEHGYAAVLARYQHVFGSREAMGRLDFTGIDVRMLGANHAVVTGHFHLTRSQAGGGDLSGIFSLVFEKQPDGWKIILDHTTDL